MLALSIIDQVIGEDGVRKLVILPVYRPLLSEGKRPTALSRITAVEVLENMLHDARLLIVGFFDQKTVVFDNFDRGWLGSPGSRRKKYHNCAQGTDEPSSCDHYVSRVSFSGEAYPTTTWASTKRLSIGGPRQRSNAKYGRMSNQGPRRNGGSSYNK